MDLALTVLFILAGLAYFATLKGFLRAQKIVADNRWLWLGMALNALVTVATTCIWFVHVIVPMLPFR